MTRWLHDGRSTLALAAVAALSVACVERRPLSEEEKREVSRYVSTEAPAPAHPLAVDFGGKVELVGYDVDPTPIRAGEAATITWHWKVKEAPGPNWKLFTHVSDGRSEDARLNLDGDGPVRKLHAPGRWKAGEFVRDPQPFTLPADWGSDDVVFYLGLWKGSDRLPVVSGPSDGDDRARAATLRVVSGAGTADDAPPSVVVPKAKGAINVDAKLDEEDWSRALETGPFVDTMTGGEASVRASARLLWDDEALYVAFEVEDPYLKSTFDDRDDHLWTEDAVELMLDPGNDGRQYFEVQVSPRGIVFDTRYDTRRKPGPYGHLDWTVGLEVVTAMRGTPNDDEADEGYVVELRLPWEAFGPAEAPGPSQTWGINLYLMDARQEGQLAGGWSPPKVGDFHVPDRFARVRFGEEAETDAAEPTPAEPPSLRIGATDLPPGVVEHRDPTPAERLRRQRELNRRQQGPPIPMPSPE